MSEDLLKMHDAARKVKDKHDIDIMVPHGVKIGGKTFPAQSKHIGISENIFSLGFRIPLENGHQVTVYANLDGKSITGRRDIPATVLGNVIFPIESGGHDHLTEDGNMDGRVRPEYTFDVPRHGATKDLVSKIKEWSEQPTIGVQYRRDGSNEVVPPEELASHLKKHTEYRKELPPPRHPNSILVVKHAFDDTESLFWDYNISTEEFKKKTWNQNTSRWST